MKKNDELRNVPPKMRIPQKKHEITIFGGWMVIFPGSKKWKKMMNCKMFPQKYEFHKKNMKYRFLGDEW